MNFKETEDKYPVINQQILDIIYANPDADEEEAFRAVKDSLGDLPVEEVRSLLAISVMYMVSIVESRRERLANMPQNLTN